MGYNITIQSNPHDNHGPSYAQGDCVNVTNLYINDDGEAAALVHELIGVVVANGESLDADAVEDLRGSLKRFREQQDNDANAAVDHSEGDA